MCVCVCVRVCVCVCVCVYGHILSENEYSFFRCTLSTSDFILSYLTFLSYFRHHVHSHSLLLIFSQSVQSLSHVWLFAIPWIAARQASLSITNSRSSLKLTTIESVMPSSHRILCRPLLLPPIPPSILVFSNESTLRMRWPKHWSFSFSIIPSKEIPGLKDGSQLKCHPTPRPESPYNSSPSFISLAVPLALDPVT